MSTPYALAAAVLLGASPAFATMAERCPITYPQFYAAVAHQDLAACPAALEGPSRFCRLVDGANGQAHVFVFTVQGQQCLLEVRAFDAGALRLASR